MSDRLDGLRRELEDLAAHAGAKAFGVADLDALRARFDEGPDRISRSFPRAIVIGLRLQRAALAGVVDRPTPLYFHNYRQLNYRLDEIAWSIADRIQDAGHRAVAVAASQLISRHPPAGHLSHKFLAWSAGIGYFGRCNLIVHPRHGAQMRYVTVLTDLPLEPGTLQAGACGACRACVAACPARAIAERREDFDLAACQAKLAEFARLPGIGQQICGVCVNVCSGAGDGTETSGR
jgi:epoxyqueuosine reductase